MSAEDRHTPESQTPLLDQLKSIEDIKSFDEEDLVHLAQEIRQRILDVSATNGGHLASPLGATELAVAIHYVFDLRQDLVIWDVGHQAHAHKILTDRKDRFHTIRRKGGISGYPKRSESPYDPFGTGHSSTSISAALGMAVARDFRGQDHHIVAVIGDGAMTGGMAYEAMLSAGDQRRPMLVILNDNEMSISKNVGALSKSLNRLLTNGLYNRAKGDVRHFMETALGDTVTQMTRRSLRGIKDALVPGALFEELGFRYVGPVDGNDIHTLLHCLESVKNHPRPVLLHCVTQKGKGYPYAEEDPLAYHGVGPIDLTTGKSVKASESGAATFTDAFAEAIIDAARHDDRIVGITAGMPTGTGLSKFEEVFPERFFDVAICEQHAVTFAAGLATQGMKPVAAIYSTFLQRGYDQFIHDVCLQDLPVVFAIDRAGLVGEDSPTQQGAFDLSFLRAIPNVSVGVPRDNLDLERMFRWCLQQDHPTAFRYARDRGPMIGSEERGRIDRGEILREGSDATFVAVGPVLGACLAAAEVLAREGISIGVVDARFVKPLDERLLEDLSDRPMITVEENSLVGGFGSAVLEHFERQDRLQDLRIKRLGIPDRFLDHMTRYEQLEECGLDSRGLVESARRFLTTGITETV